MLIKKDSFLKTKNYRVIVVLFNNDLKLCVHKHIVKKWKNNKSREISSNSTNSSKSSKSSNLK